MFGQKDGKPVDVVVVEHTYIEGNLVMQGEVLKQISPELAMELASGGKVRVATEADLKAPAKKSS